MLQIVLSSVRHNRGRYISTLLAIITGVAFFSATGIVSDRVTGALEGDAAREYRGVDLAIVPADEAGSLGDTGRTLYLDGSTIRKLAGLPGVSATAGVLTGPASFLDAKGKRFASKATGRLWVDDDELNPLTIDAGRAPTAPTEIAVDRGLAESQHLKLGQQVTVATAAGPQQSTIVGTTSFGSSDAIDEAGTISIPRSRAFTALSDGREQYEAMYLRGSAAQSALVQEAKTAVPSGFKAQTGAAFVADQAESAGELGRYIKRALQAFAILALLVGAFVIYNTFNVIIAQRMRELAVLSAIGATPKQLGRMLRAEGLVVGLVGSITGVLIAIAVTTIAIAGLNAAGVDVPGSGLALNTTNTLGAILLGTSITLLSMLAPARRAGRIEPIEAVRSAAVEPSHVSRRRALIALVLGAVGVLGFLAGSSVEIVGAAAVLLFIAPIVGSPNLVMASTRLFRPLLSRFGLEGRLAVDNVARSPRRTATTANALYVGVFLVTLVTVAGTNLRDFTVEQINKIGSADYVLTSTGATLQPQLLDRYRAIDGVRQVVGFRRSAVTIDGKASALSSGDMKAVGEVANLKTRAGSITGLKDGEIALNPRADHPRVGSTVKVVAQDGTTEELRVGAVLDPESLDTAQIGSVVTPATLERLAGPGGDTVAFLALDDGAGTATNTKIDDLAADRPDVVATEGNSLGRLIGDIFDFMIKAVNGLLMMSVVVALIGIINTLSLSILERRRELGLLRIVGMVDPLVQRMIRLEAVLIAFIGTLTGVGVGLLTGWGAIFAITRLTDANVAFSIPIGLVGVVVVTGAVLGVLASILPARRSTKASVLDALAS
ncbi:MAG: FtsX-like permease family protein [Solirubrobacteraceae bacterium]|nr:FtsX-like permease family protein [Solirubrobacteraceae bacterium]